jgi:hypothetical protein
MGCFKYGKISLETAVGQGYHTVSRGCKTSCKVHWQCKLVPFAAIRRQHWVGYRSLFKLETSLNCGAKLWQSHTVCKANSPQGRLAPYVDKPVWLDPRVLVGATFT